MIDERPKRIFSLSIEKAISDFCKCGDKRHYIIDFHHLDPSQKEVSVSDASMAKIKSESKKCILLCRNCHAEFHYLEKVKGISIQEYLVSKI